MTVWVDRIRAVCPIVGCICLSWLGVSALNHGIDGLLLASITGAICLILGSKASDIAQIIRDRKA